jgi:site-specific recombinase XerD
MKEDLKERGKAMSEKQRPTVARLVKGYMGFLVGTGKSASTISSYKGDLDLFERFLRESRRDFYRLQSRDFEGYQEWLEKAGMKMNTRRRKILSAKALVRFAVTRKKLPPSNNVQFVKAPERLERLPWIPSLKEFEHILSCVDVKTQTGMRNFLVVSLLAETGLSLAELCRIRWDLVSEGFISVEGEKRPRRLALSSGTAARLGEWRARVGNKGKYLFPGFNRHGITSEKMTPRGVELYFRVLSRSAGYRHLKPKTLRHFCIVEWLRSGLPDVEVQKRLGVHPNYSLAAYRKVLERESVL